MANPVYNIKDTGRNSARTTDVRNIAENILTSMTSVTTGTIAVTDDTHTDVSFTQPADTIIRNLIAIPAGNIVTGGSSGNDVDFSLGTASGGGQLIATKAILDDGGSLYSAAARTLHARLTPIGADLATAATTVTYLIEFLHLGSTPDQ